MSENRIDNGAVTYIRDPKDEKKWMVMILKPRCGRIEAFDAWLNFECGSRPFVRVSEALHYCGYPSNDLDEQMIFLLQVDKITEYGDVGSHWILYPVRDIQSNPQDEEHDVVVNPSHYTEGRKYQPKDVIRDWGLNFNLGNVVKYVSRAGRKIDALEDLKKARQYLDFEIEAMGKENKSGRKIDDLEKNIQYLKNQLKVADAEVRAKNIR